MNNPNNLIIKDNNRNYEYIQENSKDNSLNDKDLDDSQVNDNNLSINKRCSIKTLDHESKEDLDDYQNNHINDKNENQMIRNDIEETQNRNNLSNYNNDKSNISNYLIKNDNLNNYMKSDYSNSKLQPLNSSLYSNPLNSYNEGFKTHYFNLLNGRNKSKTDNSLLMSNNTKNNNERLIESKDNVEINTFSKESNVMIDINNNNHNSKVDTEFEFYFNQKLKLLEEELRKKMNDRLNNDHKRNLIKKIKPQVINSLKSSLMNDIKDKIRVEIELTSFKEFNNKRIVEFDKIKRKMDMMYKEKTAAHYNSLKDKITTELKQEYDIIFKEKEKEISEKYINFFNEYKEKEKERILNENGSKLDRLLEEHTQLKEEVLKLQEREEEILNNLNQEEYELLMQSEKQNASLDELHRQMNNHSIKPTYTPSIKRNLNNNNHSGFNNINFVQKTITRKTKKINTNKIITNEIDNTPVNNITSNNMLENQQIVENTSEINNNIIDNYYNTNINNNNLNEIIIEENSNEEYDNTNNNPNINEEENNFYTLNLENDCLSLEVYEMKLPLNYENYKDFLKEFLENESKKRSIYEEIKNNLLSVYMERYSQYQEDEGKNPLVVLKYLFEVWKKLDISYEKRFQILNIIGSLDFSDANKILDLETCLLTNYYHECISTINLIRKKEKYKYANSKNSSKSIIIY